MFHCLMKTIPLRIQNSIFSSKGLCYMRMIKFFYFYIFLFTSFTTTYTETVGSLASSGRDSLQVARQPKKSP